MVVMERPAPGSHPLPRGGVLGFWQLRAATDRGAPRAARAPRALCPAQQGREGGRRGGGLEGVSGWGWAPPGWLWAPPVSGAVRFPAATVTPAPKSQRLRTLHPPGKGQGWLGRPCPREGQHPRHPREHPREAPPGRSPSGGAGLQPRPPVPICPDPHQSQPPTPASPQHRAPWPRRGWGRSGPLRVGGAERKGGKRD